MKGLSLFHKNKKLRLHPNAYTKDGFGKAIPPFLTLDAEITAEALEGVIQEALKQSRADVPFQMVTPEETQAYQKAFGTRQMGPGLHITEEGETYTLTPIDKRGLFGTPVKTYSKDLTARVVELLALTKPATSKLK